MVEETGRGAALQGWRGVGLYRNRLGQAGKHSEGLQGQPVRQRPRCPPELSVSDSPGGVGS